MLRDRAKGVGGCWEGSACKRGQNFLFDRRARSVPVARNDGVIAGAPKGRGLLCLVVCRLRPLHQRKPPDKTHPSGPAIVLFLFGIPAAFPLRCWREVENPERRDISPCGSSDLQRPLHLNEPTGGHPVPGNNKFRPHQ